MKFYVSWYPGDPWYPDYDSDCNMLISITSVSQTWKLSRHKRMPNSLIVDSGGYRFAMNPNERLTPKQVFAKQTKLLDYMPAEIFLCSLDYPILNMNSSDSEKDQFISQTIGYAYEFYELVKQYHGDVTFKPVAIVQGYDVESLRFCARELKAIGFDQFGLGSMIPVRFEDELVRRVQAVVEEVGDNLHVFGISSMQVIKRLKQVGLLSIDSARPAKAAMYNQVLFWSQEHILKIWENRERGKIMVPEEIGQGQQVICPCPICEGSLNTDMMKTGARKNIYLRTVHNYWQIKQAVADA